MYALFVDVCFIVCREGRVCVGGWFNRWDGDGGFHDCVPVDLGEENPFPRAAAGLAWAFATLQTGDEAMPRGGGRWESSGRVCFAIYLAVFLNIHDSPRMSSFHIRCV